LTGSNPPDPFVSLMSWSVPPDTGSIDPSVELSVDPDVAVSPPPSPPSVGVDSAVGVLS
jgi:hypothetical protein